MLFSPGIVAGIYMNSTGRLTRFVFNAMLVTGGYVWTIVLLRSRKPCMEVLEQARLSSSIQPLADFFATLLREQSATPMPQPKG